MNEAVNRAIASKNLIESNPSILLIDSCLGTHLDRMGRYIYITVDKCGNISPDEGREKLPLGRAKVKV